MIDIFLLNRERMINSMQSSLKIIRQVCGWSAQELGEYMGVTRQTINNIENQKTSMSATQYVALCAVLDKKVKEQPHLMQALVAVLAGNTNDNKFENNQFYNSDDSVKMVNPIGNIYKNTSFLEKWFLSFPEVELNVESLNDGGVFDEKGLRTIAKHYKIFANSDTLEHIKAESFFNKFYLLLNEFNNKIIVPLRVIKFMQDNMLSFNSDIYISAKRGLNLLARLQSKGVVDIRGESSDDAVNNLVQSVFAKHRTTHRLLLLTQDKELAEDILALNNSKTIKGYTIVAGKLNSSGIIEEFNEFESDDIDLCEDKDDMAGGIKSDLELERSIDQESQEVYKNEPLGWDSID